MKNETGSSLLETLVALALVGIIGAVFLGALATSSNARVIADEQSSAKILAESQMEYARKQPYALSYDPHPISSEFTGYSAIINTDSMRNAKIQKITITVSHHDKEITSLESYKVSR